MNTQRVNARKIVRNGFPPDEGTKLANHLLSIPDVDWPSLEIDVSELTPSLLISAFINGFLQAIVDHKPELLPVARKVTWHTAFAFQRENIAKWAKQFRDFRGLPPNVLNSLS